MENFNQQFGQFMSSYPAATLVFVAWSLFWKGWALWKSAGKRQLVWFIILLLFNTLGALEILYIFYLNKWDIDGGRLLAALEKRFGKTKKVE